VRKTASSASPAPPRGASPAPSRGRIEPVIRAARPGDLPAVAALDARNTGEAKPAYWRDLHRRVLRRPKERWFLVAEAEGRFLGFAIGEIRAWEFGSPPCGWVFAIGVDPGARLRNVGSRLVDAVAERFRGAGIKHLRTMLRRDDNLNLSFFRSQGMMAGPFIQLEKVIE